MDRIQDLAAATVLLVATLLVGQAAAETLLCGDAEQESQMSQYISTVPDPLVAGQSGKVCYDFAGSGETGEVELEVTWVLSDGSTSTETVKVTPSEPCAAVTPPNDATSVQVTDQTGSSSPFGSAVSPPPPPIG